MRIATCYLACVGLLMTDALTSTPASAQVAGPAPIVASRAVAANGVETELKPANAGTGLPATIQGLWWGSGAGQQFLISFKRASWNSEKRTADLPFDASGVFGYPSSRAIGDSGAEFDQVDATQAGYKAVFSADSHHADLLIAKTLADGSREAVDRGLSLDLNSDGSWRMHGPSGDVTLRRIIGGSGRRMAAYEQYLKSFSPSVEIYGSAADLTPPQSLTLDLAADDHVVVRVGVLDPNSRNEGYLVPAPATIHAVSAAPVDLQAFGTVITAPIRSLDGHTVLLARNDHSDEGLVTVASRDGRAQRVTLTATAAPISTLDETKPLTLELAAGEIRYLRLQPSSVDAGFYRLKSSGPLAPPIYIGGNKAEDNPLSGAEVAAHGVLDNFPEWNNRLSAAEVLVSGEANAATTHTLTFTKVNNELNRRGQVVMNGPSVTGKLNAIGDLDVYDLVLPADYDDFRVMVEMDANSLDRFTVRGFDKSNSAFASIYGFAVGSSAISSNIHSQMVYVHPNTLHLAIGYYADFHVLNPDLTYTFRVKTFPKNK